MSTCALCLQERRLCKSHIVPEFIFSKLYGPDHEYHVLSAKSPERVIRRSLSEKLLCLECERKISNWEGYAASVIYGDALLRGRREGHLLIMEGLQYSPLKLFLMSLLWRSSVTSIKELRVGNLNIHQEMLRMMLINENPGEPWQYGCLFTAVMLGNKPANVIFAPSPAKIDGYQCWRLVIGGFLLSFAVASHPLPEGVTKGFLQKNGTMVISRRELHEVPYLVDIMQSFDK